MRVGRFHWLGLVAVACAALAIVGAAVAANRGAGDAASAPAPTGAEAPLALYAIALREGPSGQALALAFNRRAEAVRVFALPQPRPRLVADVTGARLRLRADAGVIDGAGAVTGIRYARDAAGAVRVVLDLNQTMHPGAQTWTREGGREVLTIALAPGAGAAAAPVAARASQAAPVSARQARRKTVVIDAGHGGRDPGAVGPTGVFEKTVTLASALELKAQLERRGGAYRVVMIRDRDVFYSLEERVRRARAAGADLFISLHADSGQTPDLKGATVYTLSEAGSRRARTLMDGQDWVIDAADQPRPGAVNDILVDLAQRETKNQSSRFAEVLLDELKPVGPLLRNSHRQAQFFVLLAPDVPALLLEMGFLTNAEDEARLRDPQFRRRQMAAVARAVDAYFEQDRALHASR